MCSWRGRELGQFRKLVFMAAVGAGALAVTGGTAAAFTVTNPISGEEPVSFAPNDFPNGFWESGANADQPGPWNGHSHSSASVLSN
jgi:hypothetical protein